MLELEDGGAAWAREGGVRLKHKDTGAAGRSFSFLVFLGGRTLEAARAGQSRGGGWRQTSCHSATDSLAAAAGPGFPSCLCRGVSGQPQRQVPASHSRLASRMLAALRAHRQPSAAHALPAACQIHYRGGHVRQPAAPGSVLNGMPFPHMLTHRPH